jgi:Family of unknown function (DUF6461)
MTQPDRGFPEVDAFAWATGSILGDAACLTLTEQAGVTAVARAFGGDPAGAREWTLAQAAGELTEVPWVALRPVGSWVLAVELNGWQGSRPEVLERVSETGRTVSAYWNVNGRTQLAYAAAGQVLTALDAVFPGRRTGADPNALVPAMAGLPWADALPVPLVLALAARLTGSPLQPSWLDGTFQVFPLEVLAEAVQPGIDPYTEALTYDDPPVAWAIRHAPEQRQRAAARAAARHAIGLAGLAGDPAVALGLRGDPQAAAPLGKLAARLDRASRKSGGDPQPAGRFWAVTALREAANPSPLAAGFRAVGAAEGTSAAFGDRPGGLSAAVLAELGDPPPPAGSLGLTATPGPLPADPYRWTARHWLAACGCITFVRGWAPDAALRAFGGSPGDAVRGLPGLYHPSLAAVRDQDGWAVLTEPSELPGLWSRYQAVRGTQAVSVSWSARGRSMFQYVADGRFVVTFDPQRPQELDGDDPAALDAQLADLPPEAWPADAARSLPLLLVLAQRVTGLAYAPELLDEEHLLAALPARPPGR